jgi:hypothetical protein
MLALKTQKKGRLLMCREGVGRGRDFVGVFFSFFFFFGSSFEKGGGGLCVCERGGFQLILADKKRANALSSPPDKPPSTSKASPRVVVAFTGQGRPEGKGSWGGG